MATMGPCRDCVTVKVLPAGVSQALKLGEAVACRPDLRRTPPPPNIRWTMRPEGP